MMRLEPNSEGSSKIQLQIPMNFEAKTKKKHSSEKKIEPNKKKAVKMKKKYKPNSIKLPGYGYLKTRYNKGEGDCFFHSTIQGLERENYANLVTHTELRQALANWYQDKDNITFTQQNISGNPSDIVPHLEDSGLNVPAVGWEKYLENKSWSWWGNIIRSPGTWVGALELPAINLILANLGIKVAINIYDSHLGIIHGGEVNTGKIVILLYLKDGHFELLEPDLDKEEKQ